MQSVFAKTKPIYLDECSQRTRWLEDINPRNAFSRKRSQFILTDVHSEPAGSKRSTCSQVPAGIWRDRWTKMEVEAWLESHGLSGQIRAEALDIEEFLTMAYALGQRWGTLPAGALDSGP